MKKISLFIEGLSFTFNKYLIKNEEKFNKLVTNGNIASERSLEDQSDIAEYKSKETLTFVYEDEVLLRAIRKDSKYMEMDNDVFVNTIMYGDDEKFDEQIENDINNMLSPNGEKCLYYPHSIDFYYDSYEMGCFDDEAHFLPDKKWVEIVIELEDYEVFDVDKLGLILRYCEYDESKDKIDLSNIYVPICKANYMFRDDIDLALLVTDKIIYDNKIIKARNYTDAEDFIMLNGYRPFIIDKDVNNITML